MAGISATVFPARLRRWELQSLLFNLVLATLAFVVLYPLMLIVLNSFQTALPGEAVAYSLQGWRAALTEPGMRAAVANTIGLSLTRELIALPLAIVLAWLLARTDLPGREWFGFMFWLSFFLPSLAVTLGWILLLDSQYGLLNTAVARLFSLKQNPFDIYSWWGIVWTHLMSLSISVKVMLLTPAFRNMDASLEEAAQVCGAWPLRTLRRVIVPVMAPAITVVALMSAIRALEAFEIELILGAPKRIDVYSTKIFRLLHQEPPSFAPATALSVITLALMLPLIALQRWVTTRRRYTTVTGQSKSQRLRLRRWKWPAFSLVLFVVLLLTVVPALSLLMGTFMRLYGFFNLAQPWTLRNWHDVLYDPIFLSSFGNTFLLGFGTAVLAVLVYSLVAYITVRTRFWGRAALDLLSWLPFTLPGIILSLGFLWLFLDVPLFRPFYGGLFLLVLASSLNSMTLGVQVIKSNMVQLGFDLEEAAWVTGGTRWYTFRRVVLPLLTPVLLLVGIMSFISATRNISHIALLVTSANRPLAMLQLDFMADARYEAAAVVGTIVVLLTVGVALVARLFGLRVGLHHGG
ncbi:MAG: hypothetical protein A3F90_14615 [Deltaproteobacteria bacterium RIFCSPLOWO2_12_FULL_60_19]|nr:MAG: hypothetical protein A3F90_14615 [Deltaproteobacteria bacterium RIFCSPLOWO2_12_FULL_60_19]